MTPADFIAAWRDNPLSERAGAQPFFLDLCELLGVGKPNDPEHYCFERGAMRTGAGRGWADVWKRGCFAWENKAPGGDLAAALKQLMTYALALDNPPLLVVCDRLRIEIHTHFTGTPSEVYRIRLEEIGQPENLAALRALFENPEQFRPRRTDHEVTQEAAGRFAAIAAALAQRGHDPRRVAHFLIQCLFCMFAEDVGLLPARLFERVVEKSAGQPEKLAVRLAELFAAMRAGGDFLLEDIAWFNGGLFETAAPLALTETEAAALRAAARMDWSAIEPAIFGTLFERGLDPALRAQLGANFTDPQTIRKIIEPVVVEPLAAEWAAVRAAMAEHLERHRAGGAGAKKARQAAEGIFLGFLERLKHFRVLDPACGSGNFLYLALRALKDLEHRANLDAEALGLHRQLSIETCPRNVLGIELNPYAAELARVTVWIGEIQWMLKHGYDIRRNPILAPLDQIECRDAVLVVDEFPPCQGGVSRRDGGVEPPAGSNHPGAARHPSLSKEGNWVREPDWPAVEVIIGNPPFLGGSKLLRELGDEYTGRLRQLYEGRVPGGADLVCYWFEKARAQIEAGQAKRAGLVATNSIRGGANRKVLERILSTPSPLMGEGGGGGEKLAIFHAWSDEPWVNDGAAVRVSLVCCGNPPNPPLQKGGGEAGGILNGQPVAEIYADLTGRAFDAGGGVDLTQALPLLENMGIMFMGASKKGSLDITGELARKWLRKGGNPNGRPNSDVLFPLWNAIDVTRRPRDMWVVDFGIEMLEAEAALYEDPFEHVFRKVKPEREQNRDTVVRENWWRFGRPRVEMRDALRGLSRYIVTPAVAKHRLFVWAEAGILPDQALLAAARSDDATFGVLHSRFHELWSLRTCTWLGKGNDPRYTPTTCFETFPFPPGVLADPDPDARFPAIAEAARRLNALREHWLNPPEWVERVPEIVPGYPDRRIPKPEFAAELKKRTLTNLYNARPAWLVNAHRQLDAAVAAAYGWSDDTPALPDAEILRRLLALNRERAGAGR